MKGEIQKFFRGEVFDDAETLETYSRDASLFAVRSQIVVWPQDKTDLENLICWIRENKSARPGLSLAIRAAGSCMSGGSLSESIVADVSKHMNKIGEVSDSISVEPGAFYRDFEKKTLEKDLLLPCYPASKNLCALGGMINNNCGGEKTLRYGKMEKFILSAKWIFSDGQEYEVKPLNRRELEAKTAQNNFEGNLYKETYNLVTKNSQLLQEAKPKVKKNSAGYYLWNILKSDVGGEEMFDLNQLLVGSQGTLGVLTDAQIRLTPVRKHHDLVALFFNSWEALPEVVNAILPYEPEGLETFDEETMKLGIRFMPEIARKAGSNLFSFALKFLPEALIGLQMGGLPKLVVLVQVSEETETEVKAKVEKIVEAVSHIKIHHRVIEKDSEEEKFWVIRRESFNLLRQHVAGKRTAPFVDDLSFPVENVTQALPEVKEILERNGLKANIAGHAGEGNFHIIPLIDPKNKKNIEIIKKVSDEVYNVVNKYHGSITGEHNDGLVRTAYLGKMFQPEVLELFRKVKNIFDPENIFNPGKKVPGIGEGEAGTVGYFDKHLDLG